jgi:tetraacyldisaccharide 4'-kinase
MLWPVLVGLSRLYGLGVVCRNIYYSQTTPYRSKCKTLSLGNLSSGGTGKTPLGLAMARHLTQKGYRVALVLRGYAAKGGISDEVQLYRKALGAEAVFVGADRQASLRQVDAAGYDVAILDDAFQHRRVHRDVNVVLLDSTHLPWDDHLLPWGFLREGCGALGRADIVMLTRTEQLSAIELKIAKQTLAKKFAKEKTFEVRTEVANISDLKGKPSNSSLDQPYYLVSAIGHPQNFKVSAQNFGVKVVGEHWFPDHHHFSKAEQLECLKQAQALGAQGVLLTSKDAVKWTETGPVFVLNIEAKVPKEFWEQIQPLLIMNHLK